MHIPSSNSRLKALREIISRFDSFGVLVTDEEASFKAIRTGPQISHPSSVLHV